MNEPVTFFWTCRPRFRCSNLSEYVDEIAGLQFAPLWVRDRGHYSTEWEIAALSAPLLALADETVQTLGLHPATQPRAARLRHVSWHVDGPKTKSVFNLVLTPGLTLEFDHNGLLYTYPFDSGTLDTSVRHRLAPFNTDLYMIRFDLCDELPELVRQIQ